MHVRERGVFYVFFFKLFIEIKKIKIYIHFH